MERKFILAGIGGQGVIYATKLLSQAALARGLRVMASENHGMSQRGGSVLSHVKFGGSAAPLIRRGTADALIAFDHVEALRSLPFVRPGGRVFVNSAHEFEAPVRQHLDPLGITLQVVDADACARELGAPAVTNVVVLGFAAALGGLGLTPADLHEAVRVLGPARAVDLNLKALDMGAARALAASPERLGDPPAQPAAALVEQGHAGV